LLWIFLHIQNKIYLTLTKPHIKFYYSNTFFSFFSSYSLLLYLDHPSPNWTKLGATSSIRNIWNDLTLIIKSLTMVMCDRCWFPFFDIFVFTLNGQMVMIFWSGWIFTWNNEYLSCQNAPPKGLNIMFLPIFKLYILSHRKNAFLLFFSWIATHRGKVYMCDIWNLDCYF